MNTYSWWLGTWLGLLSGGAFGCGIIILLSSAIPNRQLKATVVVSLFIVGIALAATAFNLP